MRRASAVLVAATALFGLLGPVSEASATTPFHANFNMTADNVARQIHCTNPRIRSQGGMVKTGLVCDLRGYRINVITFRNIHQQVEWLKFVPAAYPYGKHFVGYANGVVIIAKNGNHAAAAAGAKALHGWLYRIG